MKKEPAHRSPCCPSCGRILVNRVVDYCLFCKQDLPAELCLSETEKKVLNDEQSELRKKQMKDAEQRRAELDRLTSIDGGAGDCDSKPLQ